MVHQRRRGDADGVVHIQQGGLRVVGTGRIGLLPVQDNELVRVGPGDRFQVIANAVDRHGWPAAGRDIAKQQARGHGHKFRRSAV
ncbi:hypothetical protein D3C83_161090 [compost metagenome]